MSATLAGQGTARAQAPVSEQEVKAAYLFHFTRFVQWPAPSASEDRAFVVALLGADQFAGMVERTLAGKTTRDRPLSVRRVSSAREAADADILFVGPPEAGHLPEILKALQGRSVLTVGDFPGFAEQGGMIGFRIVDQRVRFDVNVDQASRSGLRISSEMLKLARVVRTRPGP
jgi:hypothetical protein